MLLIFFGRVLIFARPNWNFLLFFAGCMTAWWGFNAVLSAIEFGDQHPAWLILLAHGMDIAIQVAIFLGVGALIVLLRGGKVEERGPSEAEIDAELARIRRGPSASEPPPATEKPAPPDGQWTLPP